MYDTIVIGAGIAGMTAAMYAARKKMSYEIVSSEFGGQMNVSGEVLNYPGISKTTGLQMMKEMQKQMDYNGVKVRRETVATVERKGKAFTVVTDKGRYDTRTVIIATGSSPRRLGVPGEKEYANRGVAYCAICDGPLFSGMDVAIIGGGNSALEAVSFMEGIARKIYIIVKGDRFSGHEYLIENVSKNRKVQVIFGADTKEILGKDMVTGVRYEQKGKAREIKVGGVIVEIGRQPSTAAFRDILELDEDGHIRIDCQGRTKVPGIFAAGDCASGHEYQYVISAGQGCMALIKAARYLAEEKE